MSPILGGAASPPDRNDEERPLAAIKNRLPKDLWHEIDAVTVTITNPDNLLENALVGRQMRFQYLVKKFYHQIRYGCQNKFCSTPTCFSCQRRVKVGPVRRPTKLTARTLAFYLASRDGPTAALCPFPPVPETDEAELLPSKTPVEPHPRINGSLGIVIEDKSKAEELKVPPLAESMVPSPNPDIPVRQSNSPDKTLAKALNSAPQKPENSLREFFQRKYDRRSLSQSLYNSHAAAKFDLCDFRRILSAPRDVSVPKPEATEGNVDLPDGTNKKLANGFIAVSSAATDGTDERIEHRPARLHLNSRAATSRTENGLANPPRRSVSVTLNGIPTETKPRKPSVSEALRPARRLSKSGDIHSYSSDSFANGHPVPAKAKSGMKEVRNDAREEKQPLAPAGELNRDKEVEPRRLNYITPHTELHPDIIDHKSATASGKGSREKQIAASTLTCKIMKAFRRLLLLRQPRDHKLAGIIFERSQGVHYHRKIHREGEAYVAYINRSLRYSLSTVPNLLRSFRETTWTNANNSPLPHLDPHELESAFMSWNRLNGSLVYDSLWKSLESLFNPPPDIVGPKSPRLRGSRARDHDMIESHHRNHGTSEYLAHNDAAHIIMICIHALTSIVAKGSVDDWKHMRRLRSWGLVHDINKPKLHLSMQPTYWDAFWAEVTDALEYGPAVRLATRLVRAIAARRCFSEVFNAMKGKASINSMSKSHFIVGDMIVQHLIEVEKSAYDNRPSLRFGLPNLEDWPPSWSVSSTFLEWLRNIITKEWNGSVEVRRWDAVGGAIEMMAQLFEHRESLSLSHKMFWILHFHDQLDAVEMTTGFLDQPHNPNTFHILSYPFLFHPSHLVHYFRTLNYSEMSKAFDNARHMGRMQHDCSKLWPDNENLRKHAEKRLRGQGMLALVLEVRRGHALEDATNQLWGIDKAILQKPLKVRFSVKEGEMGVDQGGVSIEFFSVALAEALNPNNGMFDVDPETRMTWFRPASLEPEHRFELIGILFSLAVFNGIPLPVTFPTAFYRMLLGQPAESLDHIRDGWPTLTKGLEELLNWTDGDVGDVFIREYAFSYEAFGKTIVVDMEAHRDDEPWKEPLQDVGGQHQEEAGLVTNANRQRFVSDYVFWLTDRSIRPQFEAFKRGFFAAISPSALSLFYPETLRTLVEGYHNIDTHELEQTATYEEGYTPASPIIQEFWRIVHAYPQKRKKQLLEFVTASDRVPVQGMRSITFKIVRVGGDTESLPTSMTCFGRFLLPDYTVMSEGWENKLRRKLDVALDNSRGFGSM